MAQLLDHKHGMEDTCRQSKRKDRTSRSIHPIVVIKLDLRQCSFPVLLLVTTNTMKYVAQCAIDHFYLFIYLWVKIIIKMQSSAELVPKMTLKLANELHIPFKNYSFWNIVQTHHFLKEQICN